MASRIALYGPLRLSATIRGTPSDAAVPIVEGEAGRRCLDQVGFEVRPLRAKPAASFQAAEFRRWRDLVLRPDIRIDGCSRPVLNGLPPARAIRSAGVMQPSLHRRDIRFTTPSAEV